MVRSKNIVGWILILLFGSCTVGHMAAQSLTVTDIYDACGDQLGEATLSLSGVSASSYPLTARYTHQATGYTELFEMTGGPYTLSGLEPGEYELEFYISSTITFRSCLDIGEATMFIRVEAPDDPVCTTADIGVSVSGAHPPYTYLWSTGATTASIYNVRPGDYTLTVTDSYGCTSTEEVTIDPSHSPLITVVPACGNLGTDGRIIISNNSGLTYCEWSHTDTYQGFIADNLSPGPYQVTINDIYGCEVVKSIEVGAKASSFEVNVVEGSCPTWENGVVTIEVPEPSGTNVYPSWTSVSRLEYDNVPAGSHTLIVEELFCWSDTAASEVPYRCDCAGLFPGVKRKINHACSSTSLDGAIEYTYFNSAGPFEIESSANNQLENLPPGTYYTRLTHLPSGCSYQDTVVIKSLGSMLVREETTPECGTKEDGEVRVYVDFEGLEGQVSNTSVRVNWHSAGVSPGIVSHDPSRPFVLSDLSAGNYCYTVVSQCQSITQCVTVERVEDVDPSIIYNGCDGEVRLFATLGMSGPDFGARYLWSTGDTTDFIAGQSYGTYSVTVTNSNGCSGVATAEVSSPFCIDESVPACQGMYDGEVTITLKNPQGANMSFWAMDSLGIICADCPIGPSPTNTLIPTTNDTMVTFTLTNMPAEDHLFRYSIAGCTEDVVINPGERPFERRYIGWDSPDKHTYYCEYELSCRDHPTYTEKENAEVRVFEEGGFTGVPIFTFSIFSKCGERHYLCDGDTIASKSTRPIQLRTLQLVALLERSINLGLIPYNFHAEQTLERLRGMNPCRKWWVCLNDLSTLSTSELACKHRGTEIYGDPGEYCYRVGCRCVIFFGWSYEVCGWEFAPEWLEPYVDPEPPEPDCERRTVSMYDLGRQLDQLVEKYGEEFEDSELYQLVKDALDRGDTRMVCARVTYCVGSWDVYDHDLDEVECYELETPQIIQNQIVERTCEVVELGDNDNVLVFCHRPDCDDDEHESTCLFTTIFRPVRQTIDLEGFVVRDPIITIPTAMPDTKFQHFSEWKQGGGLTDYSALLVTEHGSLAYWNNDNSETLYEDLRFNTYNENIDQGTFIGVRKVSDKESKVFAGGFSGLDSVSFSAPSALEVSYATTTEVSTFEVNLFVTGTLYLDKEEVLVSQKEEESAFVKVMLDQYCNIISVRKVFGTNRISREGVSLDQQVVTFKQETKLTSLDRQVDLAEGDAVFVSDGGNIRTIESLSLPGGARVVAKSFSESQSMYAIYGYGTASLGKVTLPLDPSFLYVVGLRKGEIVLLDSLSASSVDLTAVYCTMDEGVYHLGGTFRGQVTYGGKDYFSRGGSDIALLTWPLASKQAAVHVTGSSSDEVLKGLRSNSGYLFFGGDMSGVEAYREIGDLVFVKLDGQSSHGFVSHIEVPLLEQEEVSSREALLKEKGMLFSDHPVLIFPNPVSSQLQVVAQEQEMNKISLYGLDGHLITTIVPQNKKRASLDVSDLDSGVYLISIYSGATVITKKVFVL